MYIPTKEILCSALYETLREHSMDHITVKMVCERAGVSRQTLYNHYYCLADMLEDMLRREIEAAFPAGACRDWRGIHGKRLMNLRWM